ncbi:TonB-dependent receptor [Mucilaginibacter sp. 21P]|uniref:SusC/RagA family TonB-linked outer membrane protein n=1 Tax=Mucilaginibacter sp. 21P TaxID=2778902 RepID=UPI001C7633F5|nr:TonB-dependent receptor [Mucilaginibacter sp. 21P]QXV65262.1 TonB-dependent receptor [Mucilaginibacter sp. 21P]
MKKIILLNFILLLLPVVLFAQGRLITGTVKDATGVLPGATVYEKGVPANVTVVTSNGKFAIRLRGTSNVLVFKYVGFSPQEVKIGVQSVIDVILQANSLDMDEVVVMAYQPKKRITSTGSVSQINASEVRTVPTANVQNTLSGRLPGFFSQQTSGQPGRDAASFYIRGLSSINGSNTPLIIVDDVEYQADQLQQINVNEIETITILKDAATTAIYGVKGANGVLVITTRRGKTGPPAVNLRIESGVQSPTKIPNFLDAYQTAVLMNEAESNYNKAYGISNGILSFTDADLAAFKNKTDPYGHPDVNWYKAILKNYTYQQNTNLDLQGGTNNVKYFITGGMLSQNGLLRDFSDPLNQINSNYDYKRYNFRSNLDMKANKNLSIRLDLSARFGIINQPHTSNILSEIYDFRKVTPFSAPFLNPNGSYAFNYSQFNSNSWVNTPSQLSTINARLANGGYDRSTRTDFNSLFDVSEKLDDLTPGLTVTGRLAYSSIEQYTKKLYRYNNSGAETFNPPSYHYNPNNGSYTLDPRGKYVLSDYNLEGATDAYVTRVNLQAFATYDRVFDGAHRVSGLLLYNQYQDNNQADAPAKFRGQSLKVGYGYKETYLIDFNGAVNGSDRFASGQRYGFFPAVSFGYNIGNEDYFKRNVSFIQYLKLRGSYGIVGSDAIGGSRYIYSQFYQNGGGYNFGTNNNPTGSNYEGTLANPNVSWESQKEFNLAIETNMFHSKLAVTLEYFRNIRYNQLIIPGDIPNVLGVGVPAVNAGKSLNRGFEAQITYQDRVGQLQYNASLVFSYAKNKILEMREAQPAYERLRQTGRPIGQIFGYKFIGYYTAADVAKINDPNVPAQDKPATPGNGARIQEGDLKYLDANGDGKIDKFDQGPIGNPNVPNTNVGLNLGIAYKGFSINALLQGAFGYSFAVVGTGVEPFKSQFQPIHQERYTPSTAATAQFPSLTTDPLSVSSPSNYLSDYWLINAHYIRLKSVDVGYQFPSRLLPFHFKYARLYISAYNLFTWRNYNKYQQDPEVATSSAGDVYPNQRIANLGVQVTF